MNKKAKSSYQHLTEKYHHAVVECQIKDKQIKELKEKLNNLTQRNYVLEEGYETLNIKHDAVCKQLSHIKEVGLETHCDKHGDPMPISNYKEPRYTHFEKYELKNLVGKTIVNTSNPDNVCIITRYQGGDFVESGKLQIAALHLVKYWLLEGKPCGKEVQE